MTLNIKRIIKYHTIWRPSLILPLGLILLASVGMWVPLPFPLRLVAVTLLATVLPGYLLLQAIGIRAEDRLEQAVLSIGGSYGLTIISALVGLYLAGSLSVPLVVGGLVALSLALAIIAQVRPRPTVAPLSPMSLLYFALPVGLAAFFSFTGLGYSDYWGDEMNGLLRALSIIGGRPDVLFEHTKGPVEVLLPAVFGLLVGRFEPFTLRFPFALAHLVGIGGFYLLGRRLFGPKVGLMAALLLALNGLYLAFGRIVQYQAVVFMMTSLALLLAYQFYRTGRSRELYLGTFLAGVGLLAHYDMLLALPPMGYLTWQHYRQHRLSWRQNWPPLVWAGLTLGAVVTLFYLPFLLHPHLAETSSYLDRIIGASNWPGNNFDELYMFTVMYNSRYYVLFITLFGLGFMLVDLLRLLYRRRRDWRLWLVSTAFLLPALLAVAGGRPAFVPLLLCTLLFTLLIGFSDGSAALKMVYVWVGVSFVGYVFFIDRPRTHLQIIFPGWSLLAALALTRLGSWLSARRLLLRRRPVTGGAAAILGLLLALFAVYQFLLFADVKREYIFTHPTYQRPIFWEDADFPFGSRRLYGAPHRLGWQMINQLYAQGELQGDWDSNDFGTNLFWYTLGAPRNPCYPRYYFLTQFEQREGAVESLPDLEAEGYAHIGQVWNRDRLQMDVYEFAPTGSQAEFSRWQEPAAYNSWVSPNQFYALPYQEDTLTPAQISHKLPAKPTFQPSPTALAHIAEHYQDPRITQVRDKVILAGYDLDDRWAKPGGALLLTLYWQAAEVVNLPYKIFAHLQSDDGQLWAQADDFPACGTAPTQRWPVGELVADRHLLRLPADMPPGRYTIQVGLYDPGTGLRMDLLDSLGNPQGVSVELPGVQIPTGD